MLKFASNWNLGNIFEKKKYVELVSSLVVEGIF